MLYKKTKIPSFLTKTALIPIASSIKSNTGYDALEVKPINIVHKIETAGFFMVSKDDEISLPERVEKLFKLYGGEPKQMFLMSGAHNETRSHDSSVAAVQFLKAVWNMLKPINFDYDEFGIMEEEEGDTEFDDVLMKEEIQKKNSNEDLERTGFFVDIEDDKTIKENTGWTMDNDKF